MLLLLSILLAAPAGADRAGWTPSARSAGRYSQGAEALSAGDPAAAEEAFRAVLERQPGCGMAQLGLGMALLRLERLDEAAAVLDDAAAAWPERAAIHTQRAELAFAAQDFERARERAAEAVALDPGSVAARRTQLNALLRLGQLDEATDALERARGWLSPAAADCLDLQLRAEAGELAAIEDLWASCQRSGEGALVEAARLVRARLQGDDAALAGAARAVGAGELAELAEAHTLAAAGDLSGALSRLDGERAAVPDSPDAWLLRARLRLMTGDRAGAASDLRAALDSGTWVHTSPAGALSGIVRASGERELLTRQADAAATLALLLLEDGEQREAAGVLAAAAERCPRTAPLALAEAELAFAGGDSEAGWAVLGAGLEAWPRDARLIEAAGRRLLDDRGPLPEATRAVLRASPDWTLPYNLAVRDYRGGDPAAALSALDGAQPDSGDARARVRALAYRCALELHDLERADALLAEAGGALSPALHHAWLRYSAGRHEEGLALLGQVDESADRPRVELLRAAMLCALGRLDEAAAAVSDPSAAPAAVTWVARAMLGAGRDAQAAALLARACPQLPARDAARCREILEAL